MLEVSVDLKTEAVVVSQNGIKTPYNICEMSGETLDGFYAHLKKNTSGQKFEGVNEITIKDSSVLMHTLLKCSLKTENMEDVSDDFIKNLPKSARKSLYEKCQEINGMGKLAEETIKNVLAESEGGGSA